MSTTDEHLKAGSSKEWNWHPDLPVAVTPLFSWPPQPAGNAALVCDQLAADDRVPDLCADGMGYMGLAGAATGADANAELGVGVAALGAQPDPDDHFFPRAAPLAVRVEETGATITSSTGAGWPRMRASSCGTINTGTMSPTRFCQG